MHLVALVPHMRCVKSVESGASKDSKRGSKGGGHVISWLTYLCALADIWGDAGAVVEAPPDDLIDTFTTFFLQGREGGRGCISVTNVPIRQRQASMRCEACADLLPEITQVTLFVVGLFESCGRKRLVCVQAQANLLV